jgi:hypothetical protein
MKISLENVTFDINKRHKDITTNLMISRYLHGLKTARYHYKPDDTKISPHSYSCDDHAECCPCTAASVGTSRHGVTEADCDMFGRSEQYTRSM